MLYFLTRLHKTIFLMFFFPFTLLGIKHILVLVKKNKKTNINLSF